MNTDIQTLADAGAHFVLCTSDKRPKKGVPWKDVRPSAGEAQAWLKENKTNLTAVVPGSLGLVVVDIDRNIKNAEAAVIEIAGVPLAAAKTRKGRHLFYPKTKSRTGNTVWEFGDIRQDDGYAIMWDMKAVVEASSKLPGDPFDPTLLPRKQSASPAEITGDEETAGRNNILLGRYVPGPVLLATIRHASVSRNGRKSLVYRTRKSRSLPKKGWSIGHAARRQ